ncbi:MAG TPA: tRNA (adenosine(37)-N6)-threonylcarbamoyltransferase complex dimerization subunit type 1 TsaB [Anaerolineae bacterium]|nr:tRNA (adenosine(37)-N6)-threonylcarbamoyltransferase complex dimerization subunit type 1 TsaB [Anaerolineae bacterium]HRJ75146.1 tRNA (adenosine(37)-N6)-threonylcarbamoyltransferase complex dimerization subunit type 1 TsaB [Anaerolineales bacterium]
MLLAVDTSTTQVGLALYNEDEVVAEMMWSSKQHHTTQLASALSDLMKRCDVTMDKVEALGVAIGPGSFTSLRVGLSLVKGIAFARNIPVIGIPTLDVIASAQPLDKKPLISVLQAGRTRLAFNVYKSDKKQWQAQGEVRSGSVDELLSQIEESTIVAGELTSEQRKKMSKHKKVSLASPANCVKRPAVLAELAWTRLQKNQIDDVATLAPIYLHVAGTPIE